MHSSVIGSVWPLPSGRLYRKCLENHSESKKEREREKRKPRGQVAVLFVCVLDRV